MISLFVAGGLSLALSLCFTPMLVHWAYQRRDLMPQPRPRDVHHQPVPRVGGVAIVASFLLSVGFVILWYTSWLNFTSERILGVDRNLFGVLAGVILLSVFNFWDDWKGLPWPVRLVSQIAAAWLVTACGIRIQWLSAPNGGHLLLGGWDMWLVIGWIVLLANSVNWLDGLNGLAGGVSAISFITIIFLFLSLNPAVGAGAVLAAIALGAVVGFLPYNWKGRVFLGDTGSVFLGFIIAVLAIISGGKLATAFLVLAVPILDAVQVFFRRLFQHHSPFLPDQNHLHHRLLALGWNERRIVLVFYLVSLLFGLVALQTQTIGKILAIVATLALMVLAGMTISIATQRRERLVNQRKNQ